MQSTVTCDSNVYIGATAGRETALGEKIVLTLSESIMGCNHKLFFDNYFTSVNLLSTLLEKSTYACGTIRTKQYPAEISEEVKKCNRGESAFRHSTRQSTEDNKMVRS